MMAAQDSDERNEYVPDLGTCYVRVLGTRLDRYVEFEFAINDPDQLMVELIMPFAAFEEFCNKHQVVRLPPRNEDDEAKDRPGLYHLPEDEECDRSSENTTSNGESK